MVTPPRTARVLARRYHLLQVLGRGAMGAVWEAEDAVLRRPVAVKEVILPPGLSPEERAVSCERTLREARAIARLGHPNVVTLFDVLDEDHRPWVVMELVPSRSLADVVKEDGPLHPLRVSTIGLAILGALEAAHAAGITHRDVKPGNILLGHDGRVKLSDFGIARAAGDATITGTGLLVGSPSYIAPEIVRGHGAGPPADLWGLGATLYAAVEGRAPFSGTDAMDTLARVVQEPPAPYERAGPLEPALTAMLTKDPARRATPVEARRLLLDVLRGSGEADFPQSGPVGRTPQVSASVLAATVVTPHLDDVDAAAHLEPAHPEPAHPEPAHPEPAHPEPAHPEPAQREPARPEPAQPEPAQAEPAAADEPPAPAASAGPSSAETAAPPGPEGLPTAAGPVASSPAAPPGLAGLLGTASSGGWGTSTGPAEAAYPTAQMAPVPAAGPPRRPLEDAPTDVVAAAPPPPPGFGGFGGFAGLPEPVEQPRRGRTGATIAIVIGLIIVAVLGGFLVTRALLPDADREGGQAGTAPGPGAGPGDVPDGFSTYSDQSGYSAAVPEGWEANRESDTVVDVEDPESERFLRFVHHQSGSGALAQLSAAEPQFADGHDDYQRVRLERTDYRDLDAADWEFTYRNDDTVRHVLYRIFVADGESYGVYLSTTDGEWDSSRTYFDTAAATFEIG